MCSQVARKLAQRGFLPDLILSSDSARTRQTLGAMADAEPAFGEAATSFRGSLYTVAALDGQTLRHLQACRLELSGPNSCMQQTQSAALMRRGHRHGARSERVCAPAALWLLG